MPHPSAPNAYPSSPLNYPSGPNAVVLDITDAAPATAYTGSPPATTAIDLTVVDATPATSRTGNQVGDAAQLGTAFADTAGTGGRTGNTAGDGIPLGIIVAGDVAVGNRTGNAGPDAPAVDRIVVDVVSASRTGRTVDVGVQLGIEALDVSGASRTVHPAATAAYGITVADDPVASYTGAQPGTVSNQFTDRQTGSRTGLPRAAVDTEITDRPVGHRVGLPGAVVVVGITLADTVSDSLTGVTVDDIAIDEFALDADGRPSGHRTGLPFQPTGITQIWTDASGGSRTGLPQITHPFFFSDTPESNRTSGSPVSLTTAQAPVPDPRLVTIWAYNFPSDPGLYPGPGVFPGLSVPFGRLLPATITHYDAPPQYTLYLADTVTGEVGYRLPFASVTWNQQLNAIGTMTATLNVEQVYDALSDADERDPKVLFAQFLQGAYRYTLVLAYGRRVVWAGPYTPAGVPAAGATVTVGATEFASLLTRRLLVTRGVANPAGVDGDVVLGPASKSGLAYLIMQHATPTNLPGYALPWTCSSPPSLVNGTESRIFYGYDTATAWDGLSNLTMEADGPDVRFEPRLDWRPDGLFLTYDMQIGMPLLALPSPWAWDVPTNAQVQWDSNVANMASTYYGLGSGQDRTKQMAVATDSRLPYLGFPALELVDSLHSSVTRQEELQSFVNADLALYSDPAVKWSVLVQASGDPQVGSYRVGDSFQVLIRDHPVIRDGTYRRRITGLSGSGSDWVTVGSADDYVVSSVTATGVQIISGGG